MTLYTTLTKVPIRDATGTIVRDHAGSIQYESRLQEIKALLTELVQTFRSAGGNTNVGRVWNTCVSAVFEATCKYIKT